MVMRTTQEIEKQIRLHPKNRRVLRQAMDAAQMAAGHPKADKQLCRMLYVHAKEMLAACQQPVVPQSRPVTRNFMQIRRDW